jgi:hypothetical protein
MVELLTKHACMKRGISQRANPENDVSRIPVRIDIIIGQRELNAESRIALCQAG